MSLEQFAAFSAELSLGNTTAEAVRARWQLTEATHRAEQLAWSQRFGVEGELYDRFMALQDHYRTWLLNSRR